MTALRRIRLGVGVVFIIAGLFHMAQNAFAALWATHRIHLQVSPTLWAHLYFGQFLFMILAGLGYLTLSFYQEGIFYYEALGDFLAGLGGFLAVIPFVAVGIVYRKISPWASLTPGLLLAAYGVGLTLGRRFGFGARDADAPV